MRVHEACKKTGLSRKAVHFYIQEGLVHVRPKMKMVIMI